MGSLPAEHTGGALLTKVPREFNGGNKIFFSPLHKVNLNAFTEVTESVVELESTGSLCRLCAVLLSQTNSWIKMKANKFYI